MFTLVNNCSSHSESTKQIAHFDIPSFLLVYIVGIKSYAISVGSVNMAK